MTKQRLTLKRKEKLVLELMEYKDIKQLYARLQELSMSFDEYTTLVAKYKLYGINGLKVRFINKLRNNKTN